MRRDSAADLAAFLVVTAFLWFALGRSCSSAVDQMPRQPTPYLGTRAGL